MGASTEEAQVQVSREVAEEVEQYLERGAFKNAINVPNVTMEQMEVLRPYIALCERIGGFAAQIAPQQQHIKKIKIRFEGTIINHNREVLTLSLLQGFLTPQLSTSVNFVNARNLLRERGVRVESPSMPSVTITAVLSL